MRVAASFAMLATACSTHAGPDASYHAGATTRVVTTQSAALRNHGNAALRISVWYPAPTTALESPGAGGGQVVFQPGRVAVEAPFADSARHPVVLLSHGFGGVAAQMSWLGTALARAGFVAIAVDHPGTNGSDGITPEGAYAPWERAGDLVAALNLVLADDRIGPHIDPARIGVTGFSMGGFTAALMVGARADLARFNAFCAGPHRDAICNRQKEFPLDYREAPRVLARPAMAQVASREKTDLRDSRVRAAYLIDPALGEMIDEASLADVHVPVRVLYGIEDAIAPPATNAQRFARGISGASTRPLERVGHYDFLAECGDAGRKVAADYCAEPADAPRARTHQTTVDDALEFFRATLAPATQGSH